MVSAGFPARRIVEVLEAQSRQSKSGRPRTFRFYLSTRGCRRPSPLVNRRLHPPIRERSTQVPGAPSRAMAIISGRARGGAAPPRGECAQMCLHHTQPTFRYGGGGTRGKLPSGGIPSPPTRWLRERATRRTEHPSGGVGFSLRVTRPFSRPHIFQVDRLVFHCRAAGDSDDAQWVGSAATGKEAKATESFCKGVGQVYRDRRRSTGRLKRRGYAPRHLALSRLALLSGGVEAGRVR